MDSNKEKYLDKIVEHLVNRTKYDTDHLNLYIIKFPFSDIWEVFGSHGEMSNIYDISSSRFVEEHRWNFDQQMIEVFDLIEHESDYVWEKYFEGARFFGNEYANSDGLINESIEDKQKDYLDYVYNDLVKNTKFRDASYRDIDLYDGKCKSLQVGIRWGSEAPYFNYVPDCLENYLKDYWGLTYNEIQELFWDKYEQHIINMVLSKKQHVSPHVRVHVDYLRESKIDKQTEFLKKVLDIMIDETIPYNLSKGSVITPFVADKNNNGKYILSANYCKNMVDDFDYEFNMGKIFIDYLEMFGLSYEEMDTIMYRYFNEIYEKYFKRFFDLSYKTKPRLDEGIDLVYIEKVTDRVLKEIVWDFDKGIVYFPMINYSAGIRDDDFLSAVAADDAFTNDISSPNTNWHVDLMDHIEDMYGITGSEWNRIWGSLQGEIWEKTEEYWDSFTSGY